MYSMSKVLSSDMLDQLISTKPKNQTKNIFFLE